MERNVLVYRRTLAIVRIASLPILPDGVAAERMRVAGEEQGDTEETQECVKHDSPQIRGNRFAPPLMSALGRTSSHTEVATVA